MQAIEITPDHRLKPCQRPVPIAKSGEVLIRVQAAGVNRPDLLQRQGKYPPPPGASDLPGLEVAGEVVGTGEAVCALLAGGGYAEYVAVPRGQCLPIPAGLSMTEAAALPETVFTVWKNLFRLGRLQPGETALIHGGSSGIGTTAIQMAKAHGARVVVTAGSDEKCAACTTLGADLAINYRTHDFVQHSGAVDVILDMVGGDYVPRNLKILNHGGRHVSIAVLHGRHADLDLVEIMQRNLTLTGSTLRPRPVEEKEALAIEIKNTVWPWIESGKLRPHIHATFPLSDAQAAHDALDSGQSIGKIVLSI